MNQSNLSPQEREAPRTHLILITTPIIFALVSILDGEVLHWSTQLNDVVPLYLRIIFCIIFVLMALVLIQISHKTLFKDNQPPAKVLTKGIFKFVRNPMYLGILLIYVAVICFSISLISIGVFIIIFFVYNKMVKVEEKILEEIFGNEFLEYKEKVPRWIPKFI
ncbi:isoprenylcysteine carboxylmethyltransferase family protein [Promethearchaeum syntrophicum]|uniref:Isoprenylcysteine carboxylmethyltransferase family protein n=1 Tax=Promethearchaeum syntrophicum TaxID=2594042 RepID=A0A5B9D8R8_9ARCH|nr:isoprenylcysteine carboxylmethyltransferase family protein [Candidatus Prometheoarchaeum syntrophicum]QEE15539.1 hypothetical protein DSAG12_01365 [Candidatus Prometheoarchaeum syntrophicum]